MPATDFGFVRGKLYENKLFIIFCTVGGMSCISLGGLIRLFCELLEIVNMDVGIQSFFACCWEVAVMFEYATGYIVPFSSCGIMRGCIWLLFSTG